MKPGVFLRPEERRKLAVSKANLAGCVAKWLCASSESDNDVLAEDGGPSTR